MFELWADSNLILPALLLSYHCYGSRLFVTLHEGCKHFDNGKQALLQTFPGWYNTRNKKQSRTAYNCARTETLLITLGLLLSGDIHQCPGLSTSVTANQPRDSGSQTHNFWGNTLVLHLINNTRLGSGDFRHGHAALPCPGYTRLFPGSTWNEAHVCLSPDGPWGCLPDGRRTSSQRGLLLGAHDSEAWIPLGMGTRSGTRTPILEPCLDVNGTHFPRLFHIQTEQRKWTAPVSVIKNPSITPANTNKHWQWRPLNHCLSTKQSIKVVDI